MITKERLEELIKQGATIYSTNWKEEVDLSHPCEIYERMFYDGVVRDVLLVHEDEMHKLGYLLSGLTEDIEAAKWEEEFSYIERTQYLVLPTWEEIKHDFIDNIKKSGSYPIVEFKDLEVGMEVYDGCGLFKGKKGTYITIYGDDNYVYELTKENYTLACRKAKELFLGSKDENNS